MAIITLTSDFGVNHYLPAALKGLFYRANPAFTLVDVSHQVAPYNYNQVAYVFGNSYASFPDFSYHVLFFNLFDHQQTRLLLVFHRKHYFILPDNGLLSMLFPDQPGFMVELPMVAEERGNSMAWAAAAVSAVVQIEQGASFSSIGRETEVLVVKKGLPPLITTDYIDAKIIFIDVFENVVVNLTAQDFETARLGRNFTILIRGDDHITRISTHYADVANGHRLAIFNSAGFLEIAINKGNAAGLFGLAAFEGKASREFQESRSFYQSVRIIFHE